MLKNYFKVAWRNLWKDRTDSFINIFGLCIAFTSALLLLLSVRYEFSFDRFHSHAKDIYHLYYQTQRQKGAELTNSMPAPLMPALKREYPGVKYGIRTMDNGTVLRYKDKKIEQNLKFTDEDFFSMFSFPILEGNAATPLHDLNDVVLRKGTAEALFGKEDPLGKTLEIQWEGGWKPFTVSAVADDFPDNSSFNYDAVVRFETVSFYPKVVTEWGSRFHDVFIQLDEKVSQGAFESQLPAFVNKYQREDIMRLKRDGVHPAIDGSLIKLSLQPLKDLHTDTRMEGGAGGHVSINKSYLYLLAAIGILILAIACVNFINLSIGRSFMRSREIGLRKTLGALRGQVALQFWGEAFLVCFIAFLVSAVLTWFLLPGYKLLFAMNINRRMLGSFSIWASVLLGFLLITGIAGGYPAWLMARLNVVEVLKGKMVVSRSNRLRNILIGFQFVTTILLISCTLISWQQLHYLRNKPLGYNTSQVISVPVSGKMDPTQELQLMRTGLAAIPSVESVSGIYNNLGEGTDGSNRESVMGFDYKNREIKSEWMGVSYDFVKTLGLKLVDGRDFSPAFATDSSAVLINEQMAGEIREKQVVGTRLPLDSAKPLTVIGVVQDFNFKSLRGKIEPLTLVLDKNFNINYILVKVKPDHLDASMEVVKSAWKTIAPRSEFKGSFLDENVNRQYKREEKLMEIFSTGAAIAISLSCMGLLAMVILIIGQRIREIGIRKILGASVGGLVMLVAKDFLILVCLATVIATPIAWYAMDQWLQSFVYRISIAWYIFAGAGLLALLIALLTVSLQAVKAAMANPANNLRSE
jgi:putative ABC transport system permease protein